MFSLGLVWFLCSLVCLGTKQKQCDGYRQARRGKKKLVCGAFLSLPPRLANDRELRMSNMTMRPWATKTWDLQEYAVYHHQSAHTGEAFDWMSCSGRGCYCSFVRCRRVRREVGLKKTRFSSVIDTKGFVPAGQSVDVSRGILIGASHGIIRTCPTFPLFSECWCWCWWHLRRAVPRNALMLPVSCRPSGRNECSGNAQTCAP